MNRTHARARLAGAALVLLSAAPMSALATVSGSANYASTPNGSGFTYDMLLKNTGDTPIRTFWFSWIPYSSFLPNVPTSVTAPAGWTDQVIQDYYGTSILWNTTGPGIFPGASLTGFDFTTSDDPTAIAGYDTYYGYYRVTTSYIYSSTVNPNDPLPGQFGVFLAAPGPVPEPTSGCALLGAASLAMLRRRRNPTRSAR